jgi:dynein intermediate chain 2
MLDREAKREKTLETTAREKRMKAQKRPNSSAARAGNDAAMDESVQSAEDEFMKMIREK